ncbi:HET-domain-containing protein [Whalleya microplaca]|nr:HET-domain-containing protein [Whalleya microplaca]
MRITMRYASSRVGTSQGMQSSRTPGVTLQDMQASRHMEKQGYRKIVLTCDQARRDGLEWAWIDTCCIDKSSSAELSEAINSMYHWYEQADVCYTYLSDVQGAEFPRTRYVDGTIDTWRVSRWFARAWTLQELIAPQQVAFYDREWKLVGNRDVARIARRISSVTGIPPRLIQGAESLSEYSVAQKMSWAAHRSCTRPEDLAYSLLGLFDINMPLLYGEGDKAFVRLQEEIFRQTDDHSLLCWTVPRSSSRAWTLESVFAKSPEDFAGSGAIRGNLYDSGSPSAMTNRGLQIRVQLSERRYTNLGSHLYHGNAGCSIFDAALNAAQCNSKGICMNWVSIILIRTPQITQRHSQSVNRYARLVTPTLGLSSLDEYLPKTMGHGELIYIHNLLLGWEKQRFGLGGIHLQNLPISRLLFPLVQSGSLDNIRSCDYSVRSVLYPGLDDEIYDFVHQHELLNPTNEMTWSPLYGCIQFGPGVQTSSLLPHFVVFGVELSRQKQYLFDIIVAWDKQHIHFGLHQGKFSLVDIPGDVSQPQLLRDKLLDPSHTSTHEGDCWAMYGEIARVNSRIGDCDIELKLVREDPDTNEGEAAGNRLHFLIVASFPLSQIEDENQDEEKHETENEKKHCSEVLPIL